MSSSNRNELCRREFLKRTGLAVGVAGTGLLPHCAVSAASSPKRVLLVSAPEDPVASAPPVRWALGQLHGALATRQVVTRVGEHVGDPASDEICVVAAGHAAFPAREILAQTKTTLPDVPESFGLVPGKVSGRPALLVCAGDVRGLVYAFLELADRVAHANNPLDTITLRTPIVEKPANTIRSVARCFVSDVEDKPWFYDRPFWQRYLTMLATQRFNRFSLAFGIGYDFTRDIRDCYFHFAYPFLVSPPGYNVSAVPLSDAERERNLETLRFISDQAALRGLDFQLGLWTHAYEWTNSPDANYTITGLTAETHAAYCRDALLALLKACPAISGVTFRIHGESGVPEGSYDFWKTVFDGIVKCGRRVEIDMHAKGMDQATVDVALATGLPVNISPKFWAEHMGLPYMQGAIRPTEMPPRDAKDTGFFSKSNGSRRFLRYGYGDLLTADRPYGVLHRIWPGTQRLLLWGDPGMAREYGRASSFCGSAGVELFEPLSFKGRKGSGLAGRRDAYADASLQSAGGDFEKYLLTYRIWGRCIYNPETEPDGWQRFLRKDFGAGAENVEHALAAASRILPLVTTAHCPSAANNNYWPEMYTNMPIVDAGKPHPYRDTPNPKRFGAVSPLDPEFFSRIDDFADELLKNESNAKYSPLQVAQDLLASAAAAEKALTAAKSKVPASRNPGFRRLAADTAIQAGLGRFFALKFQAAVLYAIYERSGHHSALKEAASAYRRARAAWSELAEGAKDIYVRDIAFGSDKHQRGHWLDRLPAIDDDIADMEKLLEQAPRAGMAPLKVETKVVENAVRLVLENPRESRPPILADFHRPPRSFQPGHMLVIETSAKPGLLRRPLKSIHLHYRHINQAETWQVQEMEALSGHYGATIPAAYTDSPFALQYYFELRDTSPAPWLNPGLRFPLMAQPYYVVRQISVSNPTAGS